MSYSFKKQNKLKVMIKSIPLGDALLLIEWFLKTTELTSNDEFIFTHVIGDSMFCSNCYISSCSESKICIWLYHLISGANLTDQFYPFQYALSFSWWMMLNTTDLSWYISGFLHPRSSEYIIPLGLCYGGSPEPMILSWVPAQTLI